MTVMSSDPQDNGSLAGHIPLPHLSTSFCPDPDLGLTPDRSPSQHGAKKTVRFISPAKSRAKRKVVMTGKENIGLAAVDLPPAEELSRTSSKARQHKQHRKCGNPKIRAERHVPSSSVAENLSDGAHLDTPELHTTLHLGRDILDLQNMNIDIVEAVKHRLAVSEPDRTRVKLKTFSKLNERPKSPSAFAETVSLNVPVEMVVEKTERQLNKTVKPLPTRPKPDMEKPSLSKFFRPELAFHHCVSLGQHGYQPQALELRVPRIDQAAFEHHDRITLWETK